MVASLWHSPLFIRVNTWQKNCTHSIMSAAELARKIDVPTNPITQILNGMRAITGDTALRLAHFFGTSAQFWLNLQSLYELRLAGEKIWKYIKGLPRLKRHEPVHA
jgi:addiction module HigA family antidote